MYTNEIGGIEILGECVSPLLITLSPAGAVLVLIIQDAGTLTYRVEWRRLSNWEDGFHI